MSRGISRRSVIRLTLAGAGTAALAACGATPAAQVSEQGTPVVGSATPQTAVETVAVEKAAEASPAPAERKELSFAWWTGGEAVNKILAGTVDRFEQAHPEYTINRIVLTYPEFPAKILTMYGAGDAPDAHGVPYGTVWAWAHKGILLDLTPLVERDAADPEWSWEDQFPAVREGCYYPPGDKIIALPRDAFGLQIELYNKNLFEEAGVETPEKDFEAGDWTWDRWREKALALTKFGDDGRRQVAGASHGASYWDLQVAMPSEGVPMFNEDVTHFNLDAPEIVEWITRLYEMMNTDRSLAKPEEANEFDWASSGKQALITGATWGFANYRETWQGFDWDFVPPPKGRCCHANFVGCDYVCVNGNDYADHESAWEMIKFFNSRGEDLWYQKEMFSVPFYQSNVETWKSYVNEVMPKNGYNYIMQMTEGAVPWTAVPFQLEMDNIHSNEIGQAIVGDRPVQEVVTSIVTKVDDMIAKFE